MINFLWFIIDSQNWSSLNFFIIIHYGLEYNEIFVVVEISSFESVNPIEEFNGIIKSLDSLPQYLIIAILGDVIIVYSEILSSSYSIYDEK